MSSKRDYEMPGMWGSGLPGGDAEEPLLGGYSTASQGPMHPQRASPHDPYQHQQPHAATTQQSEMPQWLGSSLAAGSMPQHSQYRHPPNPQGYSQGYPQQQQQPQYERGGVTNSFDFDVGGLAGQYLYSAQGAAEGLGMYPQIDDLDSFFSSMYTYYINRGLPAILLTQFCSIATLGFTIAFSVFLLACVDWQALRNCHDEASCMDFQSYVKSPFRRTGFYNFVTFCYMALFIVYWLFQVLTAARISLEGVKMESFYRRVLGISLADLQNMQWCDVMRRIITLHDNGVYRVSIQERLTEYDIVARIMRKENYMVALINKGVLDIRLPRWIVQAGMFMWEDSDKTLFLTKSLEWSINFCVLQFMFNENAIMTEEFLRDTKGLQHRFVRIGALQILMMPFMLVFMVIHFFLENAQHFRSSQSYLGPRHYSPLAMWKFREYNELPHIFEARINKSYEEANKYVALFTNGYAATLAKFVTYISGSFVAILVLISVIDEAVLLYVRLSDHNLLWYLGIFSGIFATAASFIPRSSQTPIGGGRGSGYTRNKDTAVAGGSGVETTPAEQCMEIIAAHTHHFPSYWMHQCHTLHVRDEFLELFPYKTKLFAMEILSVLLTPLVLCFSLPNCVPDMLAFMSRHTVYLDGVGDVCDYSTFDFNAYGNSEFLSPVEGDPTQSAQRDVFPDGRDGGGGGGGSYMGSGVGREMANQLILQKDRTSDGKLEQSYMSFRLANPEWEGSVGGFTAAPIPATNGWGIKNRGAYGSSRLMASMRSAGGINISTPVRGNKEATAAPPISTAPSDSEMEAGSASINERNLHPGAAGDAMLSRIRDYRHHMAGGNDSPLDQLAKSIVSSSRRQTPSLVPLFPSVNDSMSGADKKMPPLHPRRNNKPTGAAVDVANNSHFDHNEKSPEAPTLGSLKNQVSRESVVSSEHDPSQGDAETSDVEDHADGEYQLTKEEQEEQARLFGPHEGSQSISGSHVEYTDVIDRRGIDRFVGAPITSSRQTVSSSDDDMRNSISSILRSALRGENGEPYENDFYWLNKYRSERVRQSIGSSNSVGSSFRSSAGSMLGGDAAAYSQYGSPRASMVHGGYTSNNRQGHSFYQDHLGHPHSAQQRIPPRSPTAYYSSAFYHEAPVEQHGAATASGRAAAQIRNQHSNNRVTGSGGNYIDRKGESSGSKSGTPAPDGADDMASV